MRIGVIGVGSVGSTLGRRWAEKGHEVMYGLREGSGHAELGQAGSVADAAGFGEVVVFATPWSATEEAACAAGNLSGKIVLDCVNPIRADFKGLDTGAHDSAGEFLASLAPGAKVVKIFNTVGANVMQNPSFGGAAATMLYCGDDVEAKQVAAALARDLDFDPVDAGPLSQARYLEAFAWLWISLAMKYGQGREMAFELMKR